MLLTSTISPSALATYFADEVKNEVEGKSLALQRLPTKTVNKSLMLMEN